MNTTLIIMAAGIGSRYGAGIKQLEKMGANGEIIMDYSIYDAIHAGFSKVVFIIRKDIEKDFREVIGNRIEKQIEVEYVFQDINDIPNGFTVPSGRTKPWGTGQALLCCKGVVNEPFVVINADDYYGREAFVKLHRFLESGKKFDTTFTLGMAGFILKNTLSKNGVVTRGVSKVNEDNLLTGIYETTGIFEDENGLLTCDDEETKKWISLDDKVSMNMWAGYPEFIDYLEEGFVKFLGSIGDNPLKKEYLLPIIIEGLLTENEATVEVLETNDTWFGITYQADKQEAKDSLAKLVSKGIYPANLWG